MKTNWKRVFLGGILAGIIILVLSSATTQFLFKVKKPMLESFGHTIPTDFTVGDIAFGIIISLVMGIIAVWLYSAIRPRFGSGPKTALIAGFFIWLTGVVLKSGDSLSAIAYIPMNVFIVENLIFLIYIVLATLAGAWVYKE